MERKLKWLFFFGILALIAARLACDACAQTVGTNARTGNNRAGMNGNVFRRINTAEAGAAFTNTGEQMGFAFPQGETGGFAFPQQGDNQEEMTFPAQDGEIAGRFEAIREDFMERIGATQARFEETRDAIMEQMQTAQARFEETRNAMTEQMQANTGNTGNLEEMIANFTEMQNNITQASTELITEIIQAYNDLQTAMNEQMMEIIQAYADFQTAMNEQMMEIVQNFAATNAQNMETGNNANFGTGNAAAFQETGLGDFEEDFAGIQDEFQSLDLGGIEEAMQTQDFGNFGTGIPTQETGNATTNAADPDATGFAANIQTGMGITDTIAVIQMLRQSIPADTEFGAALADYEERYTAAMTEFQNVMNESMDQIMQDANNPPAELLQAFQALITEVGEISNDFMQAFANYMNEQRQNFDFNNAAAGQNLGLTNNAIADVQ